MAASSSTAPPTEGKENETPIDAREVEGERQQISSSSSVSPHRKLSESIRKVLMEDAEAATKDKEFHPSAIMDGSKLILKLEKHDRFSLDRPCKILLSTPNIKLEHPAAWQTVGICQEKENTVILDTAVAGCRFVPIPLGHFGTIYTKDGTVHVTVGSSIRRSKVQCRSLPHRVCNKFVNTEMLTESDEEDAGHSTFLDRQSTKRLLEHATPKQAMRVMRELASDPHSGVVYIRADDSLIRYRLKQNERIEIHAGRLVAWTLGVRFEFGCYCCFRFVSAVQGEGTVWIDNPRQAKGLQHGP